MIQKNVDVSNTIRVVLVSDTHIGLKGCREDIIEDIKSELRKPDTYWIGLGDFIEGREPSHKFYDPNEVTMTVGEQYERFFEYFRPFKETCLGMVLGNHETSLIMKSTINPIQMFCTDNKITYGGTTIRIVFKGGFNSLSLIANHGAGGGAKIGGNLNKAVEYGKTFNADIVTLGHYHRLAHTEEVKSYEDEEGKIHWSPMTVVLNGCTVEGYQDEGLGTYVERKMLPPCALGYAVLNIKNEQGRLSKTVELKSY